jgi:3-oxoacyl-(acyl-carrier-protein) synthase III
MRSSQGRETRGAAIPARIVATASLLPGRAIATEELVRAAMPGRDPADVERRTGIHTRHFAGDATTAALGAEVLGRALERAGMHARALRRLILVTSTGGDRAIPATAHEVASRLGIAGGCDAFDLNNACMGFLSACDVAARSVATGLAPVAVLVVETLSRHVAPSAPRPYVVLGDAAAAVLFAPARADEGLLASSLRSRGDLRSGVALEHAARGGLIEFGASNDEMTDAAIRCLRESVDEALAEARLPLAAIDWFLPHQPNGRMLERIVAAVELPAERVVPVVEEIGSVGAASIAVSLDRLLETRPVRAGQHLLLAGVGAGTAHGAMIYRVGE